jgi:hypothetical protein
MSNTWFDRTWCSHGDESQKSRNVFFACLEKRPSLLKNPFWGYEKGEANKFPALPR